MKKSISVIKFLLVVVLAALALLGINYISYTSCANDGNFVLFYYCAVISSVVLFTILVASTSKLIDNLNEY